MPVPLEDYVLAAKAKTCEQFVAEFPHPVLVQGGLGPALEATGTHTYHQGLPGKPSTQKRSPLTDPDVLVFPVKKKAGSNAFSSMVTIGRSGENDVPVRFPEVSKYHAYVSLQHDGGAKLTDGGSTNGTAVNGLGLKARVESRALEPGDTITLSGAIDLLYYTAEAFYEFLTKLTPTGASE